ncbi:MAG TPA: hypothetical protein VJR03_13625, partial [Nitrospira sp.]|nr:hypothetical protein [Nitrospira sp.]
HGRMHQIRDCTDFTRRIFGEMGAAFKEGKRPAVLPGKRFAKISERHFQGCEALASRLVQFASERAALFITNAHETLSEAMELLFSTSGAASWGGLFRHAERG